MSNLEIVHFGVKGMRWGTRRKTTTAKTSHGKRNAKIVGGVLVTAGAVAAALVLNRKIPLTKIYESQQVHNGLKYVTTTWIG